MRCTTFTSKTNNEKESKTELAKSQNEEILPPNVLVASYNYEAVNLMSCLSNK